jgi:hypothetical protein
MYCPKCGSQNSNEARFCRTCGTDLNFTQPALPTSKYLFSERQELEKGIKLAFMGVGFFLAAFFLLIIRKWWGVWLFIPAFSLLGNGVAKIVSHKHLLKMGNPPIELPHSHSSDLPLSYKTGELLPPPASVTETTTRNLDQSIQPPKEHA